MDKELIKNYERALEQKYNAVCLDVDGTLTENNSTKIDEQIISMLADLLRRYIPVVFITGRGETGLNDLISDISEKLINQYNLSMKQLSRMYALTNDGARIFMTTSDSKKLFNVNEYISSNDDFEKLNELNTELISIIEKMQLNNCCKITYSRDSVTDMIINIRIIVLSKNQNVKRQMFQIINTIIANLKNKNINLTIGLHGNDQVFQIGTATKDKAIQVTEKIIGIPQNSMLRIGDCGDEVGNDYSMLNCAQGFSVLKTSKSKDKCFPVFENGSIVTGVSGTLSLLKQAKLLPTICLEHAVYEEYAKAYARMERQMTIGKNKRFAHFNNLVNSKFLDVGGIDSLFDNSSGSIKIPMYEWITIADDNPLKQLWNTNKNFKLAYSMYDNNNILLRGSDTYYYFLAQREHDKDTGNDITSKEMVYSWLNNYTYFFNEALSALARIKDYNDFNNIKMVLGIMDNARNYLLVLLNQRIFNEYEQDNILLNFEKLPNNSLLYKLYFNLIEIEKLMKEISFNEKYLIDDCKVKEILSNTISITSEFFKDFIILPEKDNYSKEFRAYREIDNFAENFITCYSVNRSNDEIENKGVCGLCYGGLELPIIMKAINEKINDVSILKFNKNVTGYSKKQALELRHFDIFKNGNIALTGINQAKDYILMDDNLLTGKTMQLALTTFYDLKIDVSKIVIVRYPGVNRIGQMFMQNHGAIDYKYFFDFIEGLYFPSPYSWKDPNSNNLYEDSLGIFDLNRRKILECLLKNGSYSYNSEVLCLKRKV